MEYLQGRRILREMDRNHHHKKRASRSWVQSAEWQYIHVGHIPLCSAESGKGNTCGAHRPFVNYIAGIGV